MRQYSGSSGFTFLLAGAAAMLAGCAAPPPPASEPPPVVVATRPPPPEPRLEPATEPTRVRADAPLRYVVQPGDTLWDISRRFLIQPWYWPEVWIVNDQVANPHLIYPGDVLTLVLRDGQPRILREDIPGDRVLRMGPQVRSIELDRAIPAIPLEAIRDFLASPRLVDAEALRRAPYVLAFAEDQLVAGANSPAYVKGLPADADYRWAMVRPDRAIRDPENRQLLGFAATPVGALEIREFSEPAALGWITRSNIEARIGDRLIETEDEAFDPQFLPRAPENAVQGSIVWLAEERLQAVQYQVVALNRGSAHGLQPGHLLRIAKRGRKVADPHGRRDVVLPHLETGLLMVFKTRENLSFGLVLEATHPVSVLDRVESPPPL